MSFIEALPLNSSNTHDSAGIVVGHTPNFTNHFTLTFGICFQVHNDDTNNTMMSRTIGAIALHPTGNTQGGYHFMSLATGRRLTAKSWTVLPVPQDVIDGVHNLARKGHNLNNIMFKTNDHTTMLKNSIIDAITAGVSEGDYTKHIRLSFVGTEITS